MSPHVRPAPAVPGTAPGLGTARGPGTASCTGSHAGGDRGDTVGGQDPTQLSSVGTRFSVCEMLLQPGLLGTGTQDRLLSP